MTHPPEIGPRPSGPLWTTGNLVALLAAIAVGAAVLGFSWIGASAQRGSDGQIPWVNLGIAGVLLPVVAGRRWVTAGRRSVGLRLSAVVNAAEPSTVIGDGPDAGDRFVAGPTTSRYHHPDCLLVAGRTVTPQGRRTHEQAGRRACEMCQP